RPRGPRGTRVHARTVAPRSALACSGEARGPGRRSRWHPASAHPPEHADAEGGPEQWVGEERETVGPRQQTVRGAEVVVDVARMARELPEATVGCQERNARRVETRTLRGEVDVPGGAADAAEGQVRDQRSRGERRGLELHLQPRRASAAHPPDAQIARDMPDDGGERP